MCCLIFYGYFLEYAEEHRRRYGKHPKQIDEFVDFAEIKWTTPMVYDDWHNKEYLRVCMANLYEKHIFGIGKSRITDEEWARLCEGYKTITGEPYAI